MEFKEFIEQLKASPRLTNYKGTVDVKTSETDNYYTLQITLTDTHKTKRRKPFMYINDAVSQVISIAKGSEWLMDFIILKINMPAGKKGNAVSKQNIMDQILFACEGAVGYEIKNWNNGGVSDKFTKDYRSEALKEEQNKYINEHIYELMDLPVEKELSDFEKFLNSLDEPEVLKFD